MNILIDWTLEIPEGVGAFRRLAAMDPLIMTGPRAVRWVETVTIGEVLLVVLRGQQGVGLGPLSVQAEDGRVGESRARAGAGERG